MSAQFVILRIRKPTMVCGPCASFVVTPTSRYKITSTPSPTQALSL